jgi:signal transduction histidine kinase
MDKLKLKWRIFAFLLGFCALLIAILWIFQTALLTGMYKMIRRAEIEQAITLVEKNIDSPDLQSVLAGLGASKEILAAPTQEFSVADRPGRGDPNRRQMETVTETKEFVMADGQTVSLTFYAIITPVEATVSTLRVQLYIIIGIMLLCSIVLAGIIARHISKPIEEISESAKMLASGDYDTRFAGHGFLEIRELSDTLNTAAAELSQVDNLRRELMANISHDLRTPLALIYSYAEMMHDFPTEVTPEQSETIMNETKRLTSLVNDVLDASRLETGDTELRLSTYNLTESVNDTVLRIAELVKKDGYSIHFEHGSEAYVIADEIKITQAFYNLLTNAIHYCADDKNIVVRQGESGGKVKISVVDHGDGIAPENLPHIWDRYYKVSKKHRRAITGTGLGLSIVKKIIDLHGGTYGVISEPGKGSTFWFELNRA